MKLSIYISPSSAIGLLCKLLIYFELSFGFGMVQGSDYILLYINISRHHLLNELMPFVCYMFFVKNQLAVNVWAYF